MRVVIVGGKQEAQVLPPLIAPLFIPNKLQTSETCIQWVSTDELPLHESAIVLSFSSVYCYRNTLFIILHRSD
jgi:hypothetical protein